MLSNNKIYDNYADAMSACNGLGYNDTYLAKLVIAKNILAKEILNEKQQFDTGTWRTLLGLIWALNNTRINVVDFGGGGGYHYHVAKKLFGESKSIQWSIIETPEMCKEASIILSSELNYYSDINEAKIKMGQLDLVFSSSALQYCPDLPNYLRELCNLSSRYLYITRTPFSMLKNPIYGIQETSLSANGPGDLPQGFIEQNIQYPITFFPLESTYSIIQEKYKIIFTIEEDPATLFYDGKPINQYFGLFCELL